MAQYMVQVAYSTEGWAALVKAPQDRIAAVTPAVQKLGGKLEHAWFSFGDYDVVLVVDMPDAVSVAALAVAFAAGGALKGVKTTPLLTGAQGLEAMRKAGQAGYRPPSA
jgi:uncharacterized protein with GYD domain